MTRFTLDESRLDGPAALAAADPADMLRAVASSAAQVRSAAALSAEAGLERLAQDGRPRAVVVTGMGGSGIAGDVLAAVAGVRCPVPIVVHRGYGLPGWVGAADLVVPVSCSGTTEETLSAAAEAVRRGCRMLVVGAPDSPVSDLGEQAGGVFVPAPAGGRQPRASMWQLSVPLLLAADALGLLSLPPEAVEAAAQRLESVSERCSPSSDAFVNPGKALALELAGTVPMIWGSSPLTGVAAYRFACQLNENAKYPGVSGVLPEANHNQVVAFDGPFAGGPADTDDIFRDPDVDGGAGSDGNPLRLVLLRDTDEHPQVTRRVEASRSMAEARGVPVSELVPEGASELERLASIVGLVDYATVYLALLLALDPTPVHAIQELKARIAP